jgi:Rab guanine nucleotide exchange factor SEC2
MAELLQDAPLLNGDATAKFNGIDDNSQSQRKGPEADAQAMVIESLRSQIQDLFSQVTQLNNKLVQSYDRVSVLEDDLHIASSTIRSSSLKVSQLELERTQHLSALNTGLLVEKSHVTAELTRLMERATEEASQRGQAESARADIEKDLDDLSASLFSQANTMVAEARLARAQSERKVEQAELALKGAEDAIATMQQKMQALQEEKEKSDSQAEDMRVIMGKGKWVERTSQNGVPVPATHLLSSHLPYQEFLLFVAHLRSIHQVSSTPPAMSTLLPLPFLARLLTEDSCVFS